MALIAIPSICSYFIEDQQDLFAEIWICGTEICKYRCCPHRDVFNTWHFKSNKNTVVTELESLSIIEYDWVFEYYYNILVSLAVVAVAAAISIIIHI